MSSEKPRKSYYAVIPANVRYDENLTANAKLLYGEITALCEQEGYCWAQNSYFSELYGKSINTVSRWISSLEKRGHIESIFTYKEGTKEIDQRIITLSTKIQRPPIQKSGGGIYKNGEDNTTCEYKKKSRKENFSTPPPSDLNTKKSTATNKIGTPKNLPMAERAKEFAAKVKSIDMKGYEGWNISEQISFIKKFTEPTKDTGEECLMRFEKERTWKTEARMQNWARNTIKWKPLKPKL